jgi:putative nucleotidyltransferase with HDIG domain
MKLAGVKVLIVDDDFFFREILKKCVEDEGARVLAVESIGQAKQGIPMFEPDLVLSDMQMPGGSGIELLAWAKETRLKTPIVIMTGFSDLADTASAAQAGARAFLAKPFRQDDLTQVILKIKQGKAEELTVVAADAEGESAEYLKVSVEDFIVGSQIHVPIFLKLPAGTGNRFVKVAHQGQDLTLERVRIYKEKGVHHLYLTRQDYLEYVGLSVRIAKASSSVAISAEKRARLVRKTVEEVEQLIYDGNFTPEVFDHAKVLVEVNVSLLAGTDPGYMVLESIREISDELYAHAAAVSKVAILIGKQVGWTSPKTLSKVAMAGMFHDVGKRQLSRELALKPKTQMDSNELAIYETHPAKGAAILSELDFIPTDVIQAVAQHHERRDGFGFPNHLSDSKIFPLAKVIAVADAFAELYMKSAEARGKKDPAWALDRLTTFNAEGLWPDLLIALHRGLGAVVPEELLNRTKNGFARGA